MKNREIAPKISNQEVLQWQIRRNGWAKLAIRWATTTSHPLAATKDFYLRGAKASINVQTAWQAELVMREVIALLRQQDAAYQGRLLERLLDVARAAYACPEFLARRTGAMDATLQEAEALLRPEPDFASFAQTEGSL